MKLDFRITNDNPLRLPPEFKADWVGRLRSGQYKQASDYLHIGDGYCCLGVACEAAGTRWEAAGINEGQTVFLTADGRSSGVPTTDDLPHDVFDVLWQPCDAPEVFTDIEFQDVDEDQKCDVLSALMSLNDHTDATFADIADWIEANL